MEKNRPPDIDAKTEEETTDPNRAQSDPTTTPPPREKDYATREITNKPAADTPFIRRIMEDNVSENQTGQLNNSSLPNTNLQISPSTPVTGKSAETRDYRKLYYDMKKRALKLTEKNAIILTNTTAEHVRIKKAFELISLEKKDLHERIADYDTKLADYEMLKEKHHELEKASETDFKSLKTNYETAIVNKDQAIASLAKEKEDLGDMVKALKVQNAALRDRFEQEKLKVAQQNEVKLARRKSEEMIRTKSKAKKGNKGIVEELKCEYPECENKDEDALIKCNSCGKWICDTCSEARIAKIKLCINNCSTIFFACSTCSKSAEASGFTINANVTNDQEGNQEEAINQGTFVSSMKSLFKEHVTDIEKNVENMIDKKLNEKIPATLLGDTNSATVDLQDSYARKVLQVPAEVRKIIQETKNDDKVEEKEQEKRSNNFIIHGAEEFGDDMESIQKQDAEYIDDILKHLGVHQKPENILRVGDPKKSNMRPIKVTMKTKVDKQTIMSRLYRLKGTIDDFGKISITEDYTQSERDIIKSWTEKAKEKSLNDNTHVYKVRGDPKNGLKIISFKKK